MKHLEDNLQEACVRWFDLQYSQIDYLLYHPSNGGKRNEREAARFKRMGVRPGVPDLVLALPRQGYGGLYVELKVGKNTQKDTQKQWQRLTEANGNKYVVVRSIEQFISEIKEYLDKN